jgi:hypothetical protein
VAPVPREVQVVLASLVVFKKRDAYPMDDSFSSPGDDKVIQLDDYRNGYDGPEIGADSEPQEPSGDFGDPIPQEEDFDYVREPGKGKNGHRPIRWLRVREFYMKGKERRLEKQA